MIDKKQPDNVEYFKYYGSMIMNGARYVCFPGVTTHCGCIFTVR